MKKILLISMLLASPVEAKDILLPLNDREQAVMRELLDLAVKSGGLIAAQPAIVFVNRMQTLASVPEEPKLPQPEVPK